MDYFHQLLESYNKLKKRKLKLRIQEAVNPESEARAKNEMQIAQQQNATSYNSYKVPGIPKNLWIFFTKKGDAKFANAASQGNGGTWSALGGYNQKFINQDWDEFVNYFVEDSQDQNQGQEEGMGQPGMQGANPMADPTMMEPVSPISIKMEEELGPLLEDGWDNIPKNLSDGSKRFATFEEFMNSVFGDNGVSVESHILNAVRLNREGLGSITPGTDPVDPELQSRVTDKFINFFKILSKSDETLNVEDRDFIEDNFIELTDGSVTISVDSDEEHGLNFKDTLGTIKLMLGALKQKFSLNPKMVEFTSLTDKSSDEEFRGVSMEEILPLLEMINRCQRDTAILKRSGLISPVDPKSCGAAKIMSENFAIKIAKMKQVHTEWSMSRETGALDAADLSTVAFLETFVGPDSKEMFKALVDASKEGIKTRKSDYILPVGTVEGVGKRSDVIEIFNNRDAAIKALVKSGFSENRANKLIKASIAQKILQLNPTYAKFGVRAGAIKRDQEVFFFGTSLKNLLETKSINLGKGSQQGFKEFITNTPSKPELAKSSMEYLTKMAPTLGLGDISDITEYLGKMDKIGNIAKSIPAKAVVHPGNNSAKLIKVNALKELMSSVEKSIKKTHTLDDLKSGESKVMLSLIKEYNDIDDKSDDPDIIKKRRSIEKEFRDRTGYMASRVRLFNDLNSKDSKVATSARRYLAAQVYYAGASNDDSDLVDIRGLTSKENYIFNHNDATIPVIRDLLNGGKEWNLHTNNSSLTFSNKLDPRIKLTFKLEYRLREDSRTSSSIGQSSVRYLVNANRAYARYLHHNKRNIMESNIIDQLMANQKLIFEALLNSQNHRIA